jgi:hypothetical protein
VQNTCKGALIYLHLPSATSSSKLSVVSEWYQNRSSFGLHGRGPKSRKYGLSCLCHLRTRVNIEEQAGVLLNPRICRSVRTSG